MELSFLSNRQFPSMQNNMQLKSNSEAVREGFLPQSHPDILSFSYKNAVLSPIRFSARTDLHAAAETGDYNQVKDLINQYKRTPTKLYAFLREKDSRGKTALHLAAERIGTSSASIATLLLNPYEERKSIQNIPIARILLKETDLTGRIPLHSAVLSGQADLTHFLIIAGSNLNARDNGRQTALHMAANKGFSTILQDLLLSGARRDLKDSTNQTPLDLVKNSSLMRDNEIRLLSK